MSKLILFLFCMDLNYIRNAGHFIAHISYPAYEDNSCSFTYKAQKSTGKCKSFSDCPIAIDLWKREGVHPTTCWFEGFHHIVCCPNNLPARYIPPVSNSNLSATNFINTQRTSETPPKETSTAATLPMIERSSTKPTETRKNISMTTETLFNFNDLILWGQNNETCEISGSPVNGTCTNYLECPSAVAAWNTSRTDPVSCIDYFVCCINNGLPSRFANRKPRKNDDQCNFYYGPRLGFRLVAIGSPAGPNEFPYMVALGWSNPDNSTSFRCGGVLITSTFVLTAAHCTSSEGASPVLVRVGGENLNDIYYEEQKIQEIFNHPQYNSTTRTNDIALIRLNWRVEKIPACLWNEYELELTNLTAVGYGNTRFAGAPSDQLIKASLLHVPNSACQNFYDETLIASHMCAGMSRNDTCQGDSGGPLLMYTNSTFYPFVVGITSFGNPCGGDSPGVYTRVSEYIDWIEQIIWPSTTN